jgi:hypothetical protein
MNDQHSSKTAAPYWAALMFIGAASTIYSALMIIFAYGFYGTI